MKLIKIMIVFMLFSATETVAQVGIGTTVPDQSSILDVTSTSQGFLPPRMTEDEMNSIVNPVDGLTLFCTDCDPKCIYTYIDTAFVSLCASASENSSFTSDCNANGFEGLYVGTLPFTASNKFSVTITNNSFASVTIAFAIGDVVLSGDGVGSATVSGVNPASATLNPGGNQLVEYSLSGTPVIGTLEAVWTKLSLSCTNMVNVTNGGATFTLPQSATVVSVSDGPPLVDIQGVVDNASNQFTIKVPYINGLGSYESYTSSWVANNTGTGESDSNSFRISYSAGVFSASGDITVTIEVDGDGSFNATKQLFGILANIATFDFKLNGVSQGNVLLNVIGGIPDREFGDGVHDFLYIPITGEDGNIWLSNNLGANYTNVNHANFNPGTQANANSDQNAYGSLYQWGRFSDGHELINWTSSITGTGVTGLTTTQTSSNTPPTNKFIYNSGANNTNADWRSPSNPGLWQGVNGINNPCPVGYRVPTRTEWDNYGAQSGFTTNAEGATATLLKLTSGARTLASGNSTTITGGNLRIHSNTTFNYTSFYYISYGIGSSGVTGSSANLVHGRSVRCIKD